MFEFQLPTFTPQHFKNNSFQMLVNTHLFKNEK